MKTKKVKFCKNDILSHFDLRLLFDVRNEELNNSDNKNVEKLLKHQNEIDERRNLTNQFVSLVCKANGINDLIVNGADCILDAQPIGDSLYFVTSKGYVLKDGIKFNSNNEFDKDSLFAKFSTVEADVVFTITGLYDTDFQPVNPDNEANREAIFDKFKHYCLKEYNGAEFTHYEDCYNNRGRYCIIQYFKNRLS